MARPLQINVDVWSDIACPWCYVGKARLDKAIEKLNLGSYDIPVQICVKWHPYMIDVKTNPAGEEYLAYNQRRWGSDGWTISLRRSGAKDGLGFKNWKWWPNTLHGHRLVALADSVGRAAEAEHRLFSMTYEEGENISDLERICSLAEEMRLPNARDYFLSDQGTQEVIQQDKVAKSTLKISSVPHFIVENHHTFSGAQDASTIASILKKEIDLKLQQGS